MSADILSESTGIILNNEMDDFSSPGQANGYGLAPYEANLIAPGKRPLSSMVPTVIISRDEDGPRVRMALGAAGGPKIITSTALVCMHTQWNQSNLILIMGQHPLQVTINHLFLGMDIKEAVSNPRLHHQLLPMKVTHDMGVSKVRY